MKSKLKKIFSSKYMIAAITLIVATIGFGIFLLITHQKEATVDVTYITATLEKASELTTAKLHYTGFSEYHDAGVPFISKSDFVMVYQATARAGIDVNDIEVSLDANPDNKVIWVTIPEAKVLDVKVDLESIKYFDEKMALFNVDYKEDANLANALVEKDATAEVAQMGILEMANDQSEALVLGLIKDAIPNGYDVKIKKQL